jgi:hypothetical protein
MLKIVCKKQNKKGGNSLLIVLIMVGLPRDDRGTYRSIMVGLDGIEPSSKSYEDHA